MLTVEGYRKFYRTAPERAAVKAAAITRRERYGCCDFGGANRLVVGVDTYGERGNLLSRTTRVTCRVDGSPCPCGHLQLIVALYGILNRRMNDEYRGQSATE